MTMNHIRYFWDWIRYRKLMPHVWVRRRFFDKLDQLGITPTARRRKNITTNKEKSK